MQRNYWVALAIVLITIVSFLDAPARASNEDFNKAVEAVKTKDYVKAVDLFVPLANAGIHDAQYNLAILLRRGLGRPQDFRAALKWSWLAHLGNIRRAKNTSEELSEMFSDELLEEIREDVRLFLKDQIDKGNREALTQYGRFFTEILDEPNYDEAYLWYSIAAAWRVKGGIVGREEIASNVEIEMIPELQARARDIFKTMQNAPNANPPEASNTPSSQIQAQ
jgi:uncharacterized protein